MKKLLLTLITLFLLPVDVRSDQEFDPFMFSDNPGMESGGASWGNTSVLSAEDGAQTNITSEDMIFPDQDPETAVYVPEAENAAPASSEAVSASSATAKALPEENATKNDTGVQVQNVGAPTELLTDSFKRETPPPPPSENPTWVDKLTSSNPLEVIKEVVPSSSPKKDETNGDAALEKMVENAKKSSRRSNASVFDIAGVMLRMSVPQVETALKNRGFKKIMQKYQIPNFIKWRNEEKCRTSGVVGYERTEACVVEMAKKNNHQYIDSIKFAKYDTQEEIEISFTSNFTENKAYKIVYKSLTPRITGNSPKAVYLRNIKIYDFWKVVNQKYGTPDNKTDVTWGLGGNKPFLKAETGYLKLEDPMLRELDYTRMSREDQRYMNTNMYNF